MVVVTAATNADDVIDPPAGMWLAMRDSHGPLRVTKGMPAGLPNLSALDSRDSSADDATASGRPWATTSPTVTAAVRRPTAGRGATFTLVSRSDRRQALAVVVVE